MDVASGNKLKGITNPDTEPTLADIKAAKQQEKAQANRVRWQYRRQSPTRIDASTRARFDDRTKKSAEDIGTETAAAGKMPDFRRLHSMAIAGLALASVPKWLPVSGRRQSLHPVRTKPAAPPSACGLAMPG